MSDLALISQAIPQVFTAYNMLLIFGGLILGMVIGCVPGLSVTLGIILMLPLTYTFDDPASAIILLLAVYVGGMYGGSISAITLNTPGTNSAIATTFDGYPLAKKGKVKKALDTSLCPLPCSAACSLGSVAAALRLSHHQAGGKLHLRWQYFSLGIMGISLIAGAVRQQPAQEPHLRHDRPADGLRGHGCCYRRHPLLLWFRQLLKHGIDIPPPATDRPHRADPGGAETA